MIAPRDGGGGRCKPAAASARPAGTDGPKAAVIPPGSRDGPHRGVSRTRAEEASGGGLRIDRRLRALRGLGRLGANATLQNWNSNP